MQFTRLASLAAAVSTAAAQIKGFNYGSTNPDGSGKVYNDFRTEFTTAQNLVGAPGFTSARLYTMIQAGTQNSPISAIQAAIDTKTSLLLGLWASAGQDAFNQELSALAQAITNYGSAFSDLVVGISVGSEDLYRITPTGIANKAGVGAAPDVLTTYVGEVRNVIANTVLGSKPVGHVDTWTAYVNASNNGLISAVDFLGVDAYPYFETTLSNSIDNGKTQFFDAYQATVNVAQGKPVWVTETGWPLSGPQENLAVASVANSKTYWDQVGCSLFGTTNTWWYTLFDGTPAPSFGLTGASLSTTPLFDLTCPAGTSGASSASAGASNTASSPQQQASSAAPQSSKAVDSSIIAAATATATNNAARPDQTVVQSSSVQAGSSPAQAQPTTDCSTTLATVVKSTGAGAGATAVGTATAGSSAATSTSTSTAKSCPAVLTGAWEFPHLIVPVSKDKPSKAFGTSYNGKFSSVVSSIFNFDIPASDAGKTCSLVFLFPTQDQLTTSSYTFAGQGGLDVYELESPATEQTSYDSVPKGTKLGSVPDVQPGNSYVVASHECAAGKTISFEFESTGSLDLTYFQDSNPSPIGVYITTC